MVNIPQLSLTITMKGTERGLERGQLYPDAIRSEITTDAANWS